MLELDDISMIKHVVLLQSVIKHTLCGSEREHVSTQYATHAQH